METLLSVSFDNLCSKSLDRIGKGLKQVDGLLAQICLASPPMARRQSADGKFVKPLHDLRWDPAFTEFFRLQDSFEWNISSQLTETLDRLLSFAPQPTSQIAQLIVRTLETLTALLLLHPPSRSLFSRRPALLSLLDLLDPSFLAVFGPASDEALSAALTTLMAAILDAPKTARAFEAADGIATVGRVMRMGGTAAERARELLSAWLAPETPAHTATAGSKRSSSSQGSDRSTSLAETRLELSGLLPPKRRMPSNGSDTSSGMSRASGGSLFLGMDTVVRSLEEKGRMLQRTLGLETALDGLFCAVGDMG